MTIASASNADRKGAAHPLDAPLKAQSLLWSDVPVERGRLEPGWMTAAALFSSNAEIDAFLAYEGTFEPAADAKARAAFLMSDYCHIVSTATVPAFVACGLLAELSPEAIGLQFYQARHEHDGHIHETRSARIRFLSNAFHTDRAEHAAHPDAVPCNGRDEIEAQFARGIEAHFHPLVEVLHARTRLSRSAMWRLVGDAFAARFLDAGQRLGCVEQAKISAMSVLKRHGSPLANPQLQFIELTVRDDEGSPVLTRSFRARGGCCRYYTVKPGALCSTCVLKDAERRDADLLEAMRRRLAGRADHAIATSSGKPD